MMIELIIQIGVLIPAVTIIIISFNKIVVSVTKKMVEEIVKENKLEHEKIMNQITIMDYNGCKSYLTDVLTDIENKVEKSSVQIERAYEVYDHYVKNLNGNSYITTKWEKIMK